jgi:hypothetical protein
LQTLSVSPFVGVGRTAGQLRVIPGPGDPSSARSVRLAGHTVMGISAEAGWSLLPLSLRASASRTVGAGMRIGEPVAFCSDCFSFGQDEVGSASVTTFAADLVLRPLPTRIAPYVFAGLSHRRTSFKNTTPEIAPYFDVSDLDYYKILPRKVDSLFF